MAEDSDWMKQVKIGFVPTPENQIPAEWTVQHWHLPPAEVGLDEDGQTVVHEPVEIESPNFGLKWGHWREYLPNQVYWN